MKKTHCDVALYVMFDVHYGIGCVILPRVPSGGDTEFQHINHHKRFSNEEFRKQPVFGCKVSEKGEECNDIYKRQTSGLLESGQHFGVLQNYLWSRQSIPPSANWLLRQ